MSEEPKDQVSVVEEKVQTNVEQPQENHEESPQDNNWRRFREQRAQERKQLEEQQNKLRQKEEEAQALKKALESIVGTGVAQQYHQNNVQDSYGQSDSSNEDEMLKKLETLWEKKEREREEKRLQEEHAKYPQRLQSTYNDFSQICTTENLDYLEYHYPELAKPLSLLPDGYDKWESIYKACKRFLPQTDSQKDANKIEKNLQKPVALSRPGMTETSDMAPNLVLSEERRAANWERMRRALKDIG